MSCDECGKLLPAEEIEECPRCGALLCEECIGDHECDNQEQEAES